MTLAGPNCVQCERPIIGYRDSVTYTFAKRAGLCLGCREERASRSKVRPVRAYQKARPGERWTDDELAALRSAIAREGATAAGCAAVARAMSRTPDGVERKARELGLWGPPRRTVPTAQTPGHEWDGDRCAHCGALSDWPLARDACPMSGRCMRTAAEGRVRTERLVPRTRDELASRREAKRALRLATDDAFAEKRKGQLAAASSRVLAKVRIDSVYAAKRRAQYVAAKKRAR